MRIRLMLAAVLAAGASCDQLASGPDFSDDGFSVTARAGHLTLRNESSAVVHYVALEEEASALVDLYHDPQQWPSLSPGSTDRIPYADLMGYEPGAKQARVYWWTQGEHRPHVVVDLR